MSFFFFFLLGGLFFLKKIHKFRYGLYVKYVFHWTDMDQNHIRLIIVREDPSAPHSIQVSLEFRRLNMRTDEHDLLICVQFVNIVQRTRKNDYACLPCVPYSVVSRAGELTQNFPMFLALIINIRTVFLMVTQMETNQLEVKGRKCTLYGSFSSHHGASSGCG